MAPRASRARLLYGMVLCAALAAPLAASLGATAVGQTVDYACPVDGAIYHDVDWQEPRGGGRRKHQGNDVFARSGRAGLPLVAVTDGVIGSRTKAVDTGLGGVSVYLQGDDGKTYYYAHNQRNVVTPGDRVSRGSVIAYMDKTGNASQTDTHVHFEIRPGGRGPVDPYPFIEQWCGTQLGRAPEPQPAPVYNPYYRDMAATVDGQGYWLVGRDGGVFTYGLARFAGSLPGANVTPSGDIVGISADPDGGGYWLVGSDGGVFAFDAFFAGSLPGLRVTPNEGVVGMAPTPSGRGYWLVGGDGGVFAFGDAGFFGSLPGLQVEVRNIVDISATRSGKGYWLVGSDGGVFAFGDARFDNSLPGSGIAVSNITGIEGDTDGRGYILVGADGGVFSFEAPFINSLPGIGVRPNEPVLDIELLPSGRGYWLAAGDGGVFSFGDARLLPPAKNVDQ